LQGGREIGRAAESENLGFALPPARK
jgi:hypothetical protein